MARAYDSFHVHKGVDLHHLSADTMRCVSYKLTSVMSESVDPDLTRLRLLYSMRDFQLALSAADFLIDRKSVV